MTLLNKRLYKKKEPFRDAKIFIIVCEGEKREPAYFNFFNELTSQLKVFPIPNKKGRSSPTHLMSNANEALREFNSDGGDYELWFVLDTDKWKKHIHSLQEDCSTKPNWNILVSNPCFEVWLYYHFKNKPPNIENNSICQNWKKLIPQINDGGFDSTKHPTLLKHAINNSKVNFSEDGYLPNVGSTQVFRLGEQIYNLTKKILDKYN